MRLKRLFYLDFSFGISLLVLYGEADTVLGFTLGVTILEACDFSADFLLLCFILNIALGSQWNDGTFATHWIEL